jgi:hypothetical protein
MSQPGATCPVCRKPTSTWSLVSRFPERSVFCSRCRALLRANRPPSATLIVCALFLIAIGLAGAVLAAVIPQTQRAGLLVVPLAGALYLGIAWVFLRLLRRSVSLSIEDPKPVDKIVGTDIETTLSSEPATADATTPDHDQRRLTSG